LFNTEDGGNIVPLLCQLTLNGPHGTVHNQHPMVTCLPWSQECVIKGKLIKQHAMDGYVSRFIDPCSVDLCTGCTSFTHWSLHPQYLLDRRMGGPQGQSGHWGREHCWLQSLSCPARSKSLSQLLRTHHAAFRLSLHTGLSHFLELIVATVTILARSY
jgi:hypothetical protein